MGLIQKKEKHDEVDGIEIITRGDTPGDIDENDVELVDGTSAAHVAAGTTAEKEQEKAERAMLEDAADEALMPDSDDDEDDEAAGSGSQGGDGGSKRTKVIIAAAVIAVIVAAIIGFFVGQGGFGSKGADSASISEDQLDTTVASYTYNGKTSDVTAREAIESQYSLDTVKQDDGTYPTPSADSVLSYVRNKIMLDEAESRGITVSKKEMKEYAESSLGTSDYSEMATQYGVSKSQAKQIVKQQTTLQKLYKKIVGDTDTASMPEAPTEPADGNDQTASKEYADYIIGLAGDEWDSEKGTWASTDGEYYKALEGQEFTADSATYSQALTAYYTAYQKYAQSSSSASSKWTEFANGLYAKANITLYGLYA